MEGIRRLYVRGGLASSKIRRMAVGSSWSFLKAAPRRRGSGGECGGKRTKPGEGALCGPFGGMEVDGARYFACLSLILRECRLIQVRGKIFICPIDVV